ncbi:MAG TPA: ABC transporter permease [Brevundimonas sp.]|uniref:ABC transporter permease n=1 Tax=Brevundimonas sp. TaxID=1871086 RepID=UPI00260B5AD8|nr:ABC transporter permease [Brevundimonas sp.]HRO31776.1 ABC transporter permease [Brevundimonas sp.]
MWTVLNIEIRKLNRSLALLLAVTAPCLIGIFGFFNITRFDQAGPWEQWLLTSVGVWAFFMLPMSVTALTALVGQMEHSPRSWDHLRALPVPRWRLYAAKAVCVLGLVVLMSALNLALTYGAVQLAAHVKPAIRPTGDPELLKTAWVLAKVLAAALLMIAIQFWAALRFASFVPALALGIGGTFFAVVATGAKQGVFFPWQMAVNVMGEGWRHDTALMLGAGLGVVALTAAIAHLAWREAR